MGWGPWGAGGNWNDALAQITVGRGKNGEHRHRILAEGEGIPSLHEPDMPHADQEASGAKIQKAKAAAKLGIAERTVKAHLAGIYQKLGVESRTAAVALALQRKLV